jgi:uncharacterized protein (TIGR03067 family)
MLKRPLMIALSIILVGAAKPDETMEKEIKALQGKWDHMGTDFETRKEAANEHIKMVIDGKKLIVMLRKLKTTQGTITLEPTTNPRTIDLKCSDGRVVLGVYALDGDKLSITFNDPGKARPAALAPKETQWRENWKRSKR